MSDPPFDRAKDAAAILCNYAGNHQETGVGVMKTRTIPQVSPAAIEDVWQRRATAAAIAAARGVVEAGRPHPAGHSGRPPERHRMGLDRRRHPVRLDFDQGASRQPRNTSTPSTPSGRPPSSLNLERRRGRADPARARRAPVPISTGRCHSRPGQEKQWSEFLLTAMRLIRKALAARDHQRERHHPQNPAAARSHGKPMPPPADR